MLECSKCIYDVWLFLMCWGGTVSSGFHVAAWDSGKMCCKAPLPPPDELAHCESRPRCSPQACEWYMSCSVTVTYRVHGSERGFPSPPFAHILLVTQWDNLPPRLYWFNQEFPTLVRVFPNMLFPMAQIANKTTQTVVEASLNAVKCFWVIKLPTVIYRPANAESVQ